MATWTYETSTEHSIPNALVEVGYLDGAKKLYRITPNEGYVLHDSESDTDGFDPETGELTGQTIFSYTSTYTTCGKNYDFTPVQVTDENGVTHTAYGSRAFFARTASEVFDGC